jgi:hypothetical protein
MRRLALAVLTASGCGGHGAANRPGVAAKLSREVETTCVEGVNCREPQVHRHCTSVVRGYRACTTYPANGMERSTIQRRSESGWKIVVRPHDVLISGWWRRSSRHVTRLRCSASGPGIARSRRPTSSAPARNRAQSSPRPSHSPLVGVPTARLRSGSRWQRLIPVVTSGLGFIGSIRSRWLTPSSALLVAASTPLRWESSSRLTRRRVREHGDLFEGGLETRQSLGKALATLR